MALYLWSLFFVARPICGELTRPEYQPFEYPKNRYPVVSPKQRKKDCPANDGEHQSLARHTATVNGFSSCLQFLELNAYDPQTLEDMTCSHQCDESGSCSHETISCYPHRSCSVRCLGDSSCHFLVIQSEDTVDVHCGGSRSCHHLQFVHKQRGDRKYLLPFIAVPNPLRLESSQIELGEFYILGKGVSTPSILDDIKESRMRCLGSGNSESRQFGEYGEGGDTANYKTGSGHKVLYCDDCVLNIVYKYYKHILWGFLEHKRRQIVRDEKLDLRFTDSPYDYLSIEDEGHHYPLERYIYDFDRLESRVVEYIVYGHHGNLGWHVDDDSAITMVIMVSNHGNFDGGDTELRMDEDDEDKDEKLRMEWGDVIVFDSYTQHRIWPILHGNRHVMAIEWWDLGRSLRNGRTDVEVHEKDIKCLENGGGTHCWREHRGEVFNGYDVSN